MTCRPNRATGTRARLIGQEESCWGQIDTNQNAIGIEFASETLRNDINSIESQLIRADRMRSPGQQGNQRPGGDITGELQPHGIWPLLLKHALGGSVTTVGSGPYSHSLQGSVDLPEGLSFEKRFGFPDGTYRRLAYLGGKVNEFFIQVNNEGIVQARAGMLFKKEVATDDDLHDSPTYPTDNEPFNSFQGAILMDKTGGGSRTSIATIASMDMLISNNIDGDQFAIDGDPFRADLPEDLRTIGGNFSAFFTSDNWDLYEAFLENTSLSMELTFTRGVYSWQFTIPKFKVRGNATPQVPGRGPLNLDLSWEAHRDDILQTDILAAITNADPVISTAA